MDQPWGVLCNSACFVTLIRIHVSMWSDEKRITLNPIEKHCDEVSGI